MISIPDTFGKRKRDKDSIPMPIEARIPLPQSTELHPAAQQAAVVYSEALMELEQLRRMLERANLDLEVERRANEQLKATLAEERASKEMYQRYAIQVRTDLGHIVDIAIKANARATDQTGSREEAMTNVERAVQAAVIQENGNDKEHSIR